MSITTRRSIAALWLAFAAVLTGCSDAQKNAAAPPPPAVTVAKPVQRTVVDQDEYVGRFVAVDSVEVRSRAQRLSEQDRLSGRPDGEAGRPALHRRSSPLPDRARPGARQPRSGAGQSGIRRIRPRARPGAGAQQDHHRADLRAAHPGQAGGGSFRYGAGSPGSFRRARFQRVHRAARRGGRADRRPAGVGRQSGDRRDRRQHHAVGNDRLHRPDQVRVHLRRGGLSALRAALQTRPGRHRPRRRRVRFASTDRRARFHAFGQLGFRRQCHRSRLRHHPRSRGVRQ